MGLMLLDTSSTKCYGQASVQALNDTSFKYRRLPGFRPLIDSFMHNLERLAFFFNHPSLPQFAGLPYTPTLTGTPLLALDLFDHPAPPLGTLLRDLLCSPGGRLSKPCSPSSPGTFYLRSRLISLQSRPDRSTFILLSATHETC